jgi:adenylate kinase family enzyme
MEPWLPIGFDLPNGYKAKKVLQSGDSWQIIQASEVGMALIVKESLFDKWIKDRLIEDGFFSKFKYGDDIFYSLYSSNEFKLTGLDRAKSPRSKNDAISFARSLRESRARNIDVALHDAIYVEAITRILPTYSLSSAAGDDVILGYWLTGGIPISVNSTRRLKQIVSWLGAEHLREIIILSGVAEGMESINEPVKYKNHEESSVKISETTLVTVSHARLKPDYFELPGRHDLTNFFNEHVVDIINNEERYKLLGIGFPSAIILYGPPGSGKTYAVEKLTDYLEWPMFEVDASSIGSPYIHETSKKIADIFKKAIDSSPSILIIDEMDAFLSDREAGAGQHRVEEIAEFLRQIPEATKNKVLIVGMTNRIDTIDSAILRRGRFDHIIKVDYANEEEILNMLESSLSKIPRSDDIDLSDASKRLAGRPLSDAAYVVREAARLAARSGKDRIDQQSLKIALDETPVRDKNSEEHRPIGFL